VQAYFHHTLWPGSGNYIVMTPAFAALFTEVEGNTRRWDETVKRCFVSCTLVFHICRLIHPFIHYYHTTLPPLDIRRAQYGACPSTVSHVHWVTAADLHDSSRCTSTCKILRLKLHCSLIFAFGYYKFQLKHVLFPLSTWQYFLSDFKATPLCCLIYKVSSDLLWRITQILSLK
jgi:hypothetical protein